MDSLARARCLRWGSVGAGVAVLLALVLLHALRPSPDATPEDQFVDTLGSYRFETLGEAQREDLRRQWEAFPPESRARILRAVARARLEEMRAETASLTPPERSERIRQALDQMRGRRAALSAAERARIQQRLNDPQTQEMVAQILDFYRQELTARERAELDPLLQEWLVQIERLGGRR